MALHHPKPWQDPTRPEGQTCGQCGAPPGSQCRRANGTDMGEGFHEKRHRAAKKAAEASRP